MWGTWWQSLAGEESCVIFQLGPSMILKTLPFQYFFFVKIYIWKNHFDFDLWDWSRPLSRLRIVRDHFAGSSSRSERDRGVRINQRRWADHGGPGTRTHLPIYQSVSVVCLNVQFLLMTFNLPSHALLVDNSKTCWMWPDHWPHCYDPLSTSRGVLIWWRWRSFKHSEGVILCSAQFSAISLYFQHLEPLAEPR